MDNEARKAQVETKLKHKASRLYTQYEEDAQGSRDGDSWVGSAEIKDKKDYKC